MRKDVRLGLAVGGILVSVVLVYAIFFSGGKPDRNSLGKNPGDNARIDTTTTDRNTGTQRDGQQPIVNNTNRSNDRDVVVPNNTTTNTQANTGGSTPSGSTGSRGNDTSRTDAATYNTAQPVDPNPTTNVNAPDVNRLQNAGWDTLLENGAPTSLLARSETPTGNSSGSNSSNNTVAPTNIRRTNVPVAAVTTSGLHDYVVKQGDTFWTIAQSQFGDGTYYSHLMRANPTITPNRLRAGMTIKIPGKDEVVPAVASANRRNQPTTRPVDSKAEYRVEAGDSLYSISKKLYGKIDKVTQLYELNKDLIGANPAALKKGMVLRLPEPPVVVAGASH